MKWIAHGIPAAILRKKYDQIRFHLVRFLPIPNSPRWKEPNRGVSVVEDGRNHGLRGYTDEKFAKVSVGRANCLPEQELARDALALQKSRDAGFLPVVCHQARRPLAGSDFVAHFLKLFRLLFER